MFYNTNPNGQVAFNAQLTGPGITTTNDSGLWAQDSLGALQKIIREGDAFEIAPGDLRTVLSFSTISNTTGLDGRRSMFNEASELVFSATFTDGTSGVFVSTVPEPATMLPILTTILWLRRRR
jgi:hypothetical protein